MIDRPEKKLNEFPHEFRFSGHCIHLSVGQCLHALLFLAMSKNEEAIELLRYRRLLILNKKGGLILFGCMVEGGQIFLAKKKVKWGTPNMFMNTVFTDY